MLPSVITKALKIYGNLNQQQRNEMKQKFKKYKKIFNCKLKQWLFKNCLIDESRIQRH